MPALLLGGAPAASASLGQSADAPVYSVTMVARSCHQYTDVMANRARNNIQESLRDLGKDSVYADGQPVSPAVEEPNDPACAPLNGWQFTLGDGIAGSKVDNLSIVTNPAAPTAQTGTVPLLDDQGQPTGSTIAGAVNVTLTAQQLQLAQARNLWVQGGTPTDPLLGSRFPSLYGFAALRCAIDNLNGDNVEWIGYPSGVRHVFCYTYLVTPPPDASTIVVRKQLQGGTDGPGTFTYLGSISYNPGQDFQLTADASAADEQSFVRAADEPWDFEEQPLPGWTLVSLGCTPASAAVVTGAKAVVTAAPGQTVTCTYTNRRNPTGSLQLDVTTLGGVGSFPFTVQVPPPGAPVVTTTTTTRTGVAVNVATSPGSTPGTYTATETLPATTPAGSWAFTKAECNGVDVTASVTANGQDRTLVRVVPVGESVACNFTNTFTPAGLITLHKTTVGGVGSFTYVVTRVTPLAGTDGSVGVQHATTTEPGVPVLATGDPLSQLPVDDPDRDATSVEYQVTELSPPETAAGSWRLTGVTCGGVGSRQLPSTGVVVTLSPTTPAADCSFTNTFVPVATVDLSKVVSGPTAARSGPVVVQLTCADGTSVSVTGPAGASGPFALPELRVFRAATRCTATETATGVAPGASVSTTSTITDDGAVTTVPSGTASFDVRPGHAITVEVQDAYVAGSSGGGGGGGGGLPDTGSGPAGGAALIAVALIAAGGLLVLLARVRRDAAPR